MGLTPVSDDPRRLSITGELGIYTVAGLKAGLDSLDVPPSGVELDLSGVTDVDTAGLQWMLMVRRTHGSRVRFMYLPEPLRELLDFSNLLGRLESPPGGDGEVAA